jgi:thiamine-monophosphate kinase
MTDRQSEADLIQSVFAPLTLGNSGAFGLHDDLAFIQGGPQGLIVTQDQVIEGTHFLLADPLDMIARRLVRRNLSDIIAKGGIPTAAFLSLAWPKSRPRAGIAEFARGLGEDLNQLCQRCPLMGGDTSESSGHLVASLTMLGTPTAANGQPVLRNGAQVGDVIAVTGVIGDSWLGLQARLGKRSASDLEYCVAFSLAPCPPAVGLAGLIGQYAHASIDVSDGLIIDATHIAEQSGIAITLELDKIPMSSEALAATGFTNNLARAVALASGGDDYQPLMALSPHEFEAFQEAAHAMNIPLTQIGNCIAGHGVNLSFHGKPVEMPAVIGWQI